MGPVGMICTIVGLVVHISCGVLNARIWWEDWKNQFPHMATDLDILWMTLLSVLLGVFSLLARLFAWKVAPKLTDLFKRIPNIRDYFNGS